MPSHDSQPPIDPRDVPLDAESPGPEFHPWRLFGFIVMVILVLAGVSILLQILLLGPNG